MTTTMLDTDVRVDTDLRTSNESGSVAHIVLSWDPTLSVGAYVTKARVEGIPIEALCGYIWMPHKDASRLPVCEACKEIYESADRSDDSGDGLPDAA